MLVLIGPGGSAKFFREAQRRFFSCEAAQQEIFIRIEYVRYDFFQDISRAKYPHTEDLKTAATNL